MNKKVSISICSYNNYDYLFLCLESLVVQSSNKDDYEVIVLDNTPNSIIEELARKKPSFYLHYKKCIGLCKQNNFKYIQKETDGLSGARNECVYESCADLVHFIDDDTILPENFIQESIDCFSRHPDLAIFGGKVIPDWRFADRPEWLYEDLLSHLSMLDFGSKEKSFGKDGVWWLVGANICFKKSILKENGLFDLSLGRKGGNNSLLGAEENVIVKEISLKHNVIYNPYSELNHIVSPDRVNQNWFIKRMAWQSVCDILTSNYASWAHFNESFTQENLSILFKETNSPSEFKKKIQLVQHLTFGVLNSGLK
jgi:glycosyltransferase involved in cell wall biosynthesis